MMPTRPHTPSTVNGSLTPKRVRRVVENDEDAAFARRVIRAYARRVADGSACPMRRDHGLTVSGG
jgi:hypothetical protein